jgi:hypothetical protein
MLYYIDHKNMEAVHYVRDLPHSAYPDKNIKDKHKYISKQAEESLSQQRIY